LLLRGAVPLIGCAVLLLRVLLVGARDGNLWLRVLLVGISARILLLVLLVGLAA
jgi:hypothetical protein